MWRRAPTRSRPASRWLPPGHIRLSPPRCCPSAGPQSQISRHRGRGPHPRRSNGRPHPSFGDLDPNSESCLAGTKARHRSGRRPRFTTGPPDRGPQARRPGSAPLGSQPSQGVKGPTACADVQSHGHRAWTCCAGGRCCHHGWNRPQRLASSRFGASVGRDCHLGGRAPDWEDGLGPSGWEIGPR